MRVRLAATMGLLVVGGIYMGAGPVSSELAVLPDHTVLRSEGTMRLALVARDGTESPVLFRLGDAICGAEAHCGVQFFTDAAMVPEAGLPRGRQIQARVATYVRNRLAGVDEIVRPDATNPVPRP